ncbi:MAG: MerR family transcriptional regulator, partial [Chloroflexi bacterium]|nr:MerR family transcriptional regulator [Chloroflexota bacterium]
RGRGGFYNDSHLSTLLRIRTQRERGLSLGAIAGLVRSEADAGTGAVREVWTRYEIVAGVEVHIRRDIEDREQRKLLELLRAARSIMKEDLDAGA